MRIVSAMWYFAVGWNLRGGIERCVLWFGSVVHTNETYSMIRSLRGYPIIKGTRGQKGIDEQQYADIIVRLSTLLRFASEIKEMDINPLVATDRACSL